MLTMDSEEYKALIMESAAKRGEGKFEEAVALVKVRLDDMDPDCLLNAYIEILKASKEGGDEDMAREYARKIFATDPEFPGIQEYL